MIDYTEKSFPDGTMTASIKATGLPFGMHYVITLWADGKCTARSRADGNGSVRYYTHRNYEAALAHGHTWARRKIAECRRMEAFWELEGAN